MELRIKQINTVEIKDSAKRMNDCVSLLMSNYQRKKGQKEENPVAVAK